MLIVALLPDIVDIVCTSVDDLDSVNKLKKFTNLVKKGYILCYTPENNNHIKYHVKIARDIIIKVNRGVNIFIRQESGHPEAYIIFPNGYYTILQSSSYMAYYGDHISELYLRSKSNDLINNINRYEIKKLTFIEKLKLCWNIISN